MTEAGGSTTQSGIFYQNSIAALYLGRLLDVSYRSDIERVERVRVEAPTEVDDTVVSFADGHQVYIQSKEYLKNNSDDWKTLWKHFDEQFRNNEFQRERDRLLLQIGFGLQEHYELQGICDRASNSPTAEEWQQRLSQKQIDILNKIIPYLNPTGLTSEYYRELLAHIDVEILPQDAIEQDRLRDWMPHTNRTQKELFRLLRDRIGGEARVKGVFTSLLLRQNLLVESPDLKFDLPPDIGTIRTEIRSCGSLLRQHQNTISGTNIHIQREVAAKIIEWSLSDSPTAKNVSMLLDQAGMGKTVIMRDVLSGIENLNIDTLAIKADQQLSEIKDLSDIQKRLNFSHSIEQIIGRLAQLNRVVVLIDQIDALSLSLAHDQQSINVILDLVARLRRIPNVRILLSCRIFDRNTDPRLKAIETDQAFNIPRLSEAEVKNALDALQVNYDQLTAATKDLLSIPLHLDLFARALTSKDVDFMQLRGIGSLQELYALIWQHVVVMSDLSGPPISERVDVINRLTKFMDARQRTSAPQSILQTIETEHLERAVNWLASTGILIRSKSNWNFLHQTFFDYCYARQFVELGNDIVATMLSSDQGIFERPKLIQIIAYLRSFDHPLYISALQRLLYSNDLRFHLYDLLLRWFGALSNPTEDEWHLAQMLLRDDVRFPHFLSTMYGNVYWFQRIQPSISRWLEDEKRDTVALGYLRSMIDIAQPEVVELLESFLGRSEEWNDQIANTIFHVRSWKTEGAVSLFEELVYKLKTPLRWVFLPLETICDISPLTGCRIINYLFDQALKNQLDKSSQQGKGKPSPQFYSSFFLDTELRELEGAIEKAMSVASSKAPAQYVEIMITWVEKVVSAQPYRDDMQWYTSDALSHNWYDNLFRIQHAFLNSLINALIEVARNDPEIFLPIAQRLGNLPYKTPQLLLSHVFRAVPEIYAEAAFNFLIGDQRRFNLGEHEQYDSRQVISAIFPYLSNGQRKHLEANILQYFWPINKELGLNALRWSGFEQYCLLCSIPIQLLSAEGKKQLNEWQRKFPGVVISDKPITMQGGSVPSPIPNDLATKMSDRDWLRAMRKYKHGTRRNGFLGGGAEQLSGVLLSQIKSDPERFHKLFKVIPLDIDDSYVMAFANGFAESVAPAEWTIDVFRQYSNQEGRNIKRDLSYAIQRIVKQDIPDDIIAILFEWSCVAESEAESWWAKSDTNGDIYNSYFNSERGAAFGTLFRIFEAKYPGQAYDKAWQLIEFASSDNSTALRLGAIQELTYMIHHNRDKSWTLFEKLVDGHKILLETHQVREFLHWGMYKNFRRMKPFIDQMIENPKPEVQEMGAELACIAAISDKAMETEEALTEAKAFAQKMITGRTSLRRGATSVYAFNMTQGSEQYVRTMCLENIRKLVNDEDEEVRNKINQKFFSLGDEFFFELRNLMEDIAQSVYYPVNFQFADYLWRHGMMDPKWTLSIIEVLVNKTSQLQQWESGAEELMRFALRVYTSQTNDELIRREAMSVFDILMKKYAGTANNILSEWDRN